MKPDGLVSEALDSLSELEGLNDAAARVQAAIRGYLVRHQLRKEAMEQALLGLNDAAETVQRAARGNLGRKKSQELREVRRARAEAEQRLADDVRDFIRDTVLQRAADAAKAKQEEEARVPEIELYARVTMDGRLRDYQVVKASILDDLLGAISVEPQNLQIISVVAGSVIMTVAATLPDFSVANVTAAAEAMVGRTLGGLPVL